MLAALSGCGGSDAVSPGKLQACVGETLAPSPYSRPTVYTDAGVTTIKYYGKNGVETDVSVFPSAEAARHAEEEEARLGDAHDRRKANVLYSGGGRVERAVIACLASVE